MKQFAKRLLFLLFAIGPVLAFAQTTVNGRVLSDLGGAIEGASVTISGSSDGTKTDGNGNFSLRANNGQTLVISSVGYVQQRILVRDGNFINVKLVAVNKTLDEVVVAMDIKRNPRELGYSVQTVKGSDIKETQRENFVNALQGRVAGLNVTSTSGAAGASAGIVLRGYNTISGTNQPLFVVDGILIDNQTFNSNSQSGSGIGLASDGNNRNNDNTNRIADLNPSDIESVTVLKGPEATALYGSQASSGAIVITTKKARGTNNKILVNYDNAFRFQKVYRFAEINNEFGPGNANIPTALPALGSFTSFGPRWAPGTKLYDNLHHFFETGFSQTHNLSLEYGTENVSFRASGQVFDQTGVVPNNTYKKYNFKLANTTKIGKYVKLTPTVAFVNADNLRPLKSSNSTLGRGGYLVELYQWPANNDVRNFETAKGDKLTLFNPNVNSDFDNPFWSAKNNRSGDVINRVISTMGIDIDPFKWLAIAGRFGYDAYKNDGYVFTHPQSYLLTTAIGGSLDNYYRKYKGYNHTITATFKKTFGDFNTRLMLGTVWQDFRTSQYAIYGTNLKDSVSTDSSNTTENTRRRLQRNVFGLPNENVFKELANFGELSVGFKNYAFLTYSHRFESASPIPAANRNYNYPGVSLSVIASDLFPEIKKGNVVNYLKIRTSLASTARINSPYSNQRFFVNNFSSSPLPVTYTYGFTKPNPFLEPETQKTYEIGTEMRMFNNSITLEAAYYNTLCSNQIVEGFRASYATGAILNTQNAGSLRNQGVEITLNTTPIKKADFDWSVNFNFSHMWSKVLTLPNPIGQFNDYYNSDTYISNVRGGLVRNNPVPTLTGSKYTRNDAGQILIDPLSGLPRVTLGNVIIADRTPDFNLGTLNTFHYKTLTLSFLWDLKVGGDIYNGTDQLLTSLGKSQRTANREQALVIEGVLDDGKANTATPTRNTIAVQPVYQNAYYTNLPDEEFIQKDVNWLRLRDLTLSYQLPQKIYKGLKGLKTLSVFATGSDLILITNYYGADPAVNGNNPGTGGVGGYGMDLGSVSTPRGLNFGLRASF